MTVNYSTKVANASFFCMFWKALKIYRGSLYKIVWRDLIFFIVIFLTLQFTIIYVFSESQQLTFKQMRDTFYIQRERIPMRYALGFFMFLVIDRWRFLLLSIPSADTFSLLVNTAISDNSERSRLMRRATVRYLVASYILNLRLISVRMRNKFPTLQSIVNSGILLKEEEEILTKFEEQTLMTTYVIPLMWATAIINRARKERLIKNDCLVQDLLTELGNYRNKLGDLLTYDLVCIPLFYIQVVTFSMYSYYFTTIIGHQVCCEDGVPYMKMAISLICASFDFVFHVGCVKVTEVLINPFGEDDEDFEVDLMVDRNLKASNMIVDYMRIKKKKYHIYDYPVFNEKPNSSKASYGDSDEESHLYCSLEENVETQTEDKYFQIYENVPVTSPPLQLQTPSQSSSSVDYVNVSYTDEIYSSESNSRKMNKKHIYENVPVAFGSMRFQTPSQSSSYVDDDNVIYDYICTDRIISSESDARTLKETHIYENVPVTSPPLQLQTPSQGSSSVDYVNANYSNETFFSESYARKLNKKHHIYEEIPFTFRPLPFQTPSQSSSNVDNVNVIYKNIPTDEESSSKSYAGTLEEAHIYETVPKASEPMQLQTPSQSSSYVHNVNVIYKNMPTDKRSSSESDATTPEESNLIISSKSFVRTLEETNIYETVPKAPAPMQLQTPSQSSSYVDNVNVIYKNMPTDEVSSSESDATNPEDSNLIITGEVYARPKGETSASEISTPKPKNEPTRFSLAKLKFRKKK